MGFLGVCWFINSTADTPVLGSWGCGILGARILFSMADVCDSESSPEIAEGPHGVYRITHKTHRIKHRTPAAGPDSRSRQDAHAAGVLSPFFSCFCGGQFARFVGTSTRYVASVLLWIARVGRFQTPRLPLCRLIVWGPIQYIYTTAVGSFCA